MPRVPRTSLALLVSVLALLLSALPAVRATSWACELREWCNNGGAREFLVAPSDSEDLSPQGAMARCAAEGGAATTVTYSHAAAAALHSVGESVAEVWTRLRLSAGAAPGPPLLEMGPDDEGTASDVFWVAVDELGATAAPADRCLTLVRETGKLAARNCSGYAVPVVMCERTGRPAAAAAWARSSLIEFEYARFTIRLARAAAAEECQRHGAMLAYFPLHAAEVLEELRSLLLLNDTVSYWTAFDDGAWESQSIELPPTGGSLPSGPQLMLNFSLVAAGSAEDAAPFVCARLPRPWWEMRHASSVHQQHFRFHDDIPSLYFRYAPRWEPANITAGHSGVTPEEAAADCALDGGETYKFGRFAEVNETFGNVTDFLTTTLVSRAEGEVGWIDESPAPIPEILNATFLYNQSQFQCYFFRFRAETGLGVNDTSALAPPPVCARRLPTLCQYNVTTTISIVDFSNSTIALAPNASATIMAWVNRPPAPEQTVRWCATGVPSALEIPCLNFAVGAVLSEALIEYKANIEELQEAVDLSWSPSCTPVSACDGSFTTTIAPSALRSIQFGNVSTASGTFEPMQIDGAIFGQEVELPALNVSSETEFASSISLFVQVDGRQGFTDTTCLVSPSSALLHADGAALHPRVLCENASALESATNVTVLLNSSSAVLGGASAPALANFILATVRFSWAQNLTVLNTTAPPFGEARHVLLSVAQPLSNLSWVRRVCALPIAYGSPGLTATPVCFLSTRPHETVAQSTLSVTNYSHLTSPTWIEYAIEGNAALAFGLPQRTTAHWEFSLLNVSISGLQEEEFVAVPVIVTVSIPHVPPAEANLTVELFFAPETESAACGMERRLVELSAALGERAVEVRWTPTCMINATMEVALSGELRHLFDVAIARAELHVAEPAEIVVGDLPRAFFLNAPPFVVDVALPSPIKDFNVSLCAAVANMAPEDAPISITPSCLYWNETFEASQAISIVARKHASQAVLNWTLSGTARMYTVPSQRVFDVWNQTLVHMAMRPSAVYFVHVWYPLRLVFDVLPLGDEQLVVEPRPHSGTPAMVEVERTVVTAQSERVVDVQVQFLYFHPENNTATIPLRFNGSARNNYYVHTMSPTVARVVPQVTLTVSTPAFLLFGEGSGAEAAREISLKIDHPPRGSARIVVTLVASSALHLHASSVTWTIGDRQERRVMLESVFPSETANVTFSVAAFDSSDRPTGEVVPAIQPASWAPVPVRFKTIVAPSFPPPRGEVIFVLGRAVASSINVSMLPAEGQLSIRLSGASNFLAMSPPTISFTADSDSTVQSFVIVPIAVTSTEVTFRFELFGTALEQFTLNNQDNAYTAVVRNRITLAAPLLPTELISGIGERRTVDITLPSLPPEHETIVFELRCQGCEAALGIVPSLFEWTSTSNTTVTVELSPQSAALANLTAAIVGGNSSGFAGFSRLITIRDPSPVVVTFPSGRLYAGETALIGIDIGHAVLATDRFLEVSASATTSCCVFVASHVLVFRADTPLVNRTLQHVRVWALNSIEQNETVTVTLQLSGSALVEFDVTQTVRVGVLTFRPRRWVRAVGMPDVIYAGEPTTISVAIAEHPDPGTNIVVRANDNLGGAVWEGTVGNLFVTPPNRTTTVILTSQNPRLRLVTASNDPAQLARFRVEGPYDVVVVPKVTISFGGGALYSTQVIGAPSNQSILVSLNRLPLAPLTLEPVFSSVFPATLSFSPPVLHWPPQSVSNSTPLTKSIAIIGELISVARDVRFDLDGHTPELAVVQTHVVITTLSIVAPHSIMLQGAFDRLYLGTANRQRFNVTISSAPRRLLVIECSFEPDSAAVLFFPQRVRFVPGPLTPLLQTVEVVGVNAGVIGEVVLSVLEGPEYNPVVSGSLSFPIVPLIRSWLTVAGVEATLGSTITVPSDAITHAEFYINEYPAVGERATFFLEYTVIPVGATLQQNQYFTIENTTLIFDPATNQGQLSQPVHIIATTLTPLTVEVRVVAPDRPFVVPGVQFNITVAPSIGLNVTGFPATLIGGDVNEWRFSVVPARAPPLGALVEAVLSTRNCDEVAVSTSRSLAWAIADAAVPVIVTLRGNNTMGQCDIVMRQRSSILGQRTPLHTFFDRSLTLLPAPVVRLTNATSARSPNTLQPVEDGVQTDFRLVRDTGATFGIAIHHGALLPNFTMVGGSGSGTSIRFNFTLALRTPENVQRLRERSEYHAVLFVARSEQEDPRGILARRGERGFITVQVVSETFLRLTIGPLSSLLLLRPEELQLHLFRRAFAGAAEPEGSDAWATIRISEYVPSVLSDADIVASSTVSILALAGVAAAPPVLFQPTKLLKIIVTLDCPNHRLDNFGSFDAAPLVIAAGILALVLLAGAAHLLLVMGFYVQRRTGSTRRFSDICGRFAFPSLDLMLVFATVIPAMEYATWVLVEAPLIEHRIAAFAIALPFAVVVPAVANSVVVRSTSLTFEEVLITNKMRKQPWFVRLMRKSGRWRHPDPSYVKRFWFLFSEQRGSFRWYLLFEFLAAAGIGVATGTRPTSRSRCVAQAATLLAIVALQLLAVLMWRPFRVMFWNISIALIYFVQLCAAALVTNQVGKEVRDDDMQRAGIALMIMSGVLFNCAVGIHFAAFIIGRAKGKINETIDHIKKQAHAGTAGELTKNLDAPDDLVNEAGETEVEGNFGDGSPALEVPLRPKARASTGETFADGIGAADDDDDDDDADAQAAIAQLEDVQRCGGATAPQGIFQTPNKHNVSFSPARRRELEHELELRRQRAREQERLGHVSSHRSDSAAGLALTVAADDAEDGEELGKVRAQPHTDCADTRRVTSVDDLPWLRAAVEQEMTAAAAARLRREREAVENQSGAPRRFTRVREEPHTSIL